jgi:hypothetical protein
MKVGDRVRLPSGLLGTLVGLGGGMAVVSYRTLWVHVRADALETVEVPAR